MTVSAYRSAVNANVQIEKAERALESCRTLLKNNDTVGACNCAYYAMFYAAHAALWASRAQEMGAIIKTHTGLISIVGQKLVIGKAIDAGHGRALARVHSTRLLADYTAEPPTDEAANTSLELAEAFIVAMRQVVEREETSSPDW